MDQDLWLKALHYHGSLLLQTIVCDIPDTECKISEKLRICKFIKKKISFLFKSIVDSAEDERTESAIPTLPIELFQNVSQVERRDLFFSSLDHGSILLLKVVNDMFPDYYKLLVLGKHASCMKLDDLSLLMFLPKLPSEIKIAGELQCDDLLRAVVCSCSIDERKIFVTIDKNIFYDESDQVPLGKISKEDLPPYIGELNVGSNYVEYLRHIPAFHDPEWDKELETVLGLENTRMYSFLEEWDGKTYPEDECSDYIKKEHTLFFSNKHYKRAAMYSEEENNTEAFLSVNKALSICPENVEALVLRGNLYFKIDDIGKAISDMDVAVRLEPSNKIARHQISKFLVSLANMHFNNQAYNEAQECLRGALTHNSENNEAAIMLKSILENQLTQISLKSGLNKSLGSKIMNSASSSCSTPNSKLGEPKDSHDSSLIPTVQDSLSRMKSPHRKKRRHHHRHRHKKHTFKS